MFERLIEKPMPNLKYAFLHIILIISVIFSFCNSKSDASEPDEYAARFISELNPTDSLLFNIPKSDTSLLRLKRKDESSFRLPSIENGYDSIQIRIWFGCALGPQFLVILKSTGNSWSSELSKLIYEVDSAENIKCSRQIKNGDPKSGWKNLTQETI